MVDEAVLHEVRRILAPEPDSTVTARRRAAPLAPPAPEVGALLRWAARTVGARAVVEVGAAGGVSGAWLLPELPPRGVLTSIEPDAHAHGLATDAFEAMDAGASVRSIHGDPLIVLDRLSDTAYDLVVLQSRPAVTPGLLTHARRLLRPGGMLVIRGALRGGDDADDVAAALQTVAEDEGFTATVLPVDNGLVLATRLATPDEPERQPNPVV
jgi:predicted O-methyltransferase YrrM